MTITEILTLTRYNFKVTLEQKFSLAQEILDEFDKAVELAMKGENK